MSKGEDTPHEVVRVSEVLENVVASRAELEGCAASLREAARELDRFASGLDADLDVTGLKFASLGINAAAHRSTFAILTARALGERLAFGARLVEVRS